MENFEEDYLDPEFQRCSQISGELQVCFLKQYGNEQKFFCMRGVNRVDINTKKQEIN